MKQWDDEKMLAAPTPSSSVRAILNRLSGRLWNPRRRIVRTAMCAILLVFGCALYWTSQGPSIDDFFPASAAFTLSNVSGFVNMGALEKHKKCDDIQHRGEIGVQESLHVDDDLVAIARSLDDHPMVDYGDGKKQHTFEELVSKTWLRMAQSSVWLEKYQVYLTVTRVLFYNKGVRHWPAISFVRGQIHDRHWQELKGYVVRWEDERIVFPRIFDIPIPYAIGGGFYGPEDPRVIIEEHPDAEPVIVFNMMSDVNTKRRAMYVYRPFSNKAILIAMRGKEPGGVEKNWMPFFYKSQDKEESMIPGPNRYLHFVYLFSPLTIVKCRLQYGWCDEVYHQQIPDEHRIEHKDTIHGDAGGSLRGGTNFQSVTFADGKQSFVGFPRTHVDGTCKDGFYRPELAVLSATADTQFHIDYLSGPLDFGTAVIHNSSDACAEGRILIANSIAKWDKTHVDDTMTLSVSVDDFTTEVVRLRGVHAMLRNLPGVSTPYNHDASQKDNLALSVPGHDVHGCCIQSAIRGAEMAYTLSPQKARNDAERVQERKKQEEKRKKEEEEAKKREEEEKRKKEEEEAKKRKEAEDEKQKQEDNAERTKQKEDEDTKRKQEEQTRMQKEAEEKKQKSKDKGQYRPIDDEDIMDLR